MLLLLGEGICWMKTRSRALLLGLSSVLVLLLAAPSAFATTTYPDYFGSDVDFTGIQETTTTDPEPDCCFNAPVGIGNQLLFFPTQFSASAAGMGGFDQTSSQLQLMFASNDPLFYLEQMNITEFGDADLTGTGTAATYTFAGLSGFVTVTEDKDGPLAMPVVIPFTGIFDPSDTLALPGDSGTTIWSATAAIDIAAYVPFATKAFLSYDNNLYAFSEDGTSAMIQKKVVNGPAIIIEVVPEPATFALVGAGLLGLALQGRRRTRN
jgi:hypothetical protein